MQAVHVKNTWGSHCDKLLFMSTEEDRELGAVKLQVEEGRQGLWGKTKQGFKYVYDNHFEEFEWFMKADDDTFVIVENLKYLLANYSTNDPIHFGHHFKYLGVSIQIKIQKQIRTIIPGLLRWRGWLRAVQGVPQEVRGGGDQQ